MENTLQKKKPSFFLVIAVTGLLAVVIGFGKTFILPVATHSFSAPPIIHIHAAFAFAWILLFLTQTVLIHTRRYTIHQALGYTGVFIAAGVLITMVPAGMHVVQRDLDHGVGESAYSTLIGVITSGLLFFSLVLSGIVKRKNPGTHKRLMLLATLLVLWPAWFRFRHYFPSVPRPDIWFALVLADSFIVLSWIWDKWKNGAIHPVLFFTGLFIIAEQSFEVLFYDSPAWRQAARWLFELL